MKTPTLVVRLFGATLSGYSAIYLWLSYRVLSSFSDQNLRGSLPGGIISDTFTLAWTGEVIGALMAIFSGRLANILTFDSPLPKGKDAEESEKRDLFL